MCLDLTLLLRAKSLGIHYSLLDLNFYSLEKNVNLFLIACFNLSRLHSTFQSSCRLSENFCGFLEKAIVPCWSSDPHQHDTPLKILENLKGFFFSQVPFYVYMAFHIISQFGSTTVDFELVHFPSF